MRFAVIVLAFETGCQIVFPIEDPNPHVELDLANKPVLAGVQTQLNLAIAGHANAVVAYTATATAGTLALDSGRATLSEVGIASESLAWTPPDEPIIATLAVDSGYDEVLEGNQVTLDVPLQKRLGHDIIDTNSALNLMGPMQMLAVPIEIPASCHTIDLGLRATAETPDPTQAMVGIYSDANGMPGTLIVATPAMPMMPMPPANTPYPLATSALETDLGPGHYWLVAASDQAITISGTSGGTEALISFSGVFPLPATFPSGAGSFQGVWSLSTTVVAQ